MPYNEVAILNRSCGAISDADAAAIVAALQVQVDRDYAPRWNGGAALTFVASDDLTSWAGKWNILLLDRLDTAGPVGSHALTPEGQPLGHVYVGDDLASGTAPSVTVSHELLEMLGNPHANLLVRDKRPTAVGLVFYTFENCDAVQADELGYAIDGIQVSDFVLPRYFDSLAAAGPFDFREHLSGPLTIAPGGYMTVLNIDGTGAWAQLEAPDGGPAAPAAGDPSRPGGGTRKRRIAGPNPRPGPGV
jgi:hypothetical protein